MNITAANNSRFTWFSPVLNPVHQFFGQLASLAMMLENWRRREQVSMQAAYIDPRTLRDAGISEAQRFIVVNNPFHE